VSTFAISRALRSIEWSWKFTRQIPRERNTDLRDRYLHSLSESRSHHLVYVDELGCSRRAGQRDGMVTDWGAASSSLSVLRGHRYQILPAYAEEGIVLSRILQGSANASISKILLTNSCSTVENGSSQICPRRADNASFHCTERVKGLRPGARVKLIYLILRGGNALSEGTIGIMQVRTLTASLNDCRCCWCARRKRERTFFDALFLLLRIMKMRRLLIPCSF
jgi:hypothetical protein